MIKVITLAILSLGIFASSACAQPVPMSASKFEGLRGKIKTVSYQSTIFDASGRIARGKDEIVVVRTYDKAGNETGYLSRVKGIPTIRNTQWETGGEFFSKNERLNTPDVSDPPPPPLRKIDSQESKKTVDKSFDFKYRPDFDKKGILISKLVYGNDGTLLSKRVYTYDRAENKVKETVFTDNGTRYNDSTLYTYDASGNLAGEINFGSANGIESEARISHKLRYEYLSFDKKGNWLERKVFDSVNNNRSEGESKLVRIEYQTVTYY